MDITSVSFYPKIFVDATTKTQCLEELVFAPTINDVLVRYMDGMVSVLLRPRKILVNLTRYAAQHT